MIPARAAWLLPGLALAIGVAAAVVPAVCTRLAADPSRVALQAQADYAAGRYDRAEAGLARLASLRPPTPMDRMARALVARARGRLADALAELGRIPRDHRLSPMAELMAGRVELQRGRARPAEAHFLAALARDPEQVQPHRELAYLYNIQRRLAEMDRQLDAIAERGALGYDQLVHWGKTRNGIWRPAEDSATLERFVAADPDDRWSRLTLADGRRQMSQPDAAAAVLAPMPESDPEARARRAMIAIDRGEPGRADRLLAGGPADDPSLARVRGQLAVKRGDLAAAIRWFRIASQADPDDRAVCYGLGAALRLSGDPAAARPYLEAARRHDALTPLFSDAATTVGERDPTLPARMGSACEAAGRFAEARAWYRMAVARDPLDSAAQGALYRLGRVRPERSSSGRHRASHAVGDAGA